VCVRLPEVPVIVSGYVPGATVPSADTDSVLIALPPLVGVTLVGPTIAVMPEGAPVTTSDTALLKPFCEVTVAVLVCAAAERATVSVVGLAVSVKSGAG